MTHEEEQKIEQKIGEWQINNSVELIYEQFQSLKDAFRIAILEAKGEQLQKDREFFGVVEPIDEDPFEQIPNQ